MITFLGGCPFLVVQEYEAVQIPLFPDNHPLGITYWIDNHARVIGVLPIGHETTVGRQRVWQNEVSDEAPSLEGKVAFPADMTGSGKVLLTTALSQNGGYLYAIWDNDRVVHYPIEFPHASHNVWQAHGLNNLGDVVVTTYLENALKEFQLEAGFTELTDSDFRYFAQTKSHAFNAAVVTANGFMFPLKSFRDAFITDDLMINDRRQIVGTSRLPGVDGVYPRIPTIWNSFLSEPTELYPGLRGYVNDLNSVGHVCGSTRGTETQVDAAWVVREGLYHLNYPGSYNNFAIDINERGDVLAMAGMLPPGDDSVIPLPILWKWDPVTFTYSPKRIDEMIQPREQSFEISSMIPMAMNDLGHIILYSNGRSYDLRETLLLKPIFHSTR